MTIQELMSESWKAITGSENYTFGTADKEFSLPVKDMTEGQIVALFRYGRRMFNDNWNSQKTSYEGDQEDFYSDWIDALGVTIGTGKGGGGGSVAMKPELQAQWDAIGTILMSAPLSRSEAATKKFMGSKRDFKKDPETLWYSLARARIVVELGKQGESAANIQKRLVEVTDANFDKLRRSWEKTVELKLAALQAQDDDLDLSL